MCSHSLYIESNHTTVHLMHGFTLVYTYIYIHIIQHPKGVHFEAKHMETTFPHGAGPGFWTSRNFDVDLGSFLI